MAETPDSVTLIRTRITAELEYVLPMSNYPNMTPDEAAQFEMNQPEEDLFEAIVGGSDEVTLKVESSAIKVQVEYAKQLTQGSTRLGCQDDDGRPVHPDCQNPEASCMCGR